MTNEYNKLYCRCYLRETGGLYGKAPAGKENVLKAMAGMLNELDREMCVVIDLDKGMTPQSYNIVSIGTLNASLVHPREVFKPALLEDAAYIVVLHNHPSGDPSPSQEDIAVTRKLIDAGRIFGVPLVDHIVVGGVDNAPLLRSIQADYGAIWEMEGPGRPGIKEVSVRVTKEEECLPKVSGPGDAVSGLLPFLGYPPPGRVLVCGLDVKGRPVSISLVGEGSLLRGSGIRNVLREQAAAGAAYCLAFRSRDDSETAFHKRSDVTLAGKLLRAGSICEIPLKDYIVAEECGAYYSFSEAGRMEELKHIHRRKEQER